jgi:hypothetical protein
MPGKPTLAACVLSPLPFWLMDGALAFLGTLWPLLR